MDAIRELTTIRDYPQIDEWAAPVIDLEELVVAESLRRFDARTPSLLRDEALLHAIADGAVWAMESLYQRYNRSLYSLIFRMIANQQIAEDLLQDAFLAVWRRADSYSREKSTVRNWLFSIAHHRTVDYLRKIRCQSAVQEELLEEGALHEGLASPDAWDEAWRSMKSTHVQQALMKIPSEQRSVIELAYFHGWTHTEIAGELQIPLGTVKGRMRLGLTHLKRILIQMGMDEI
jgi:RNA polymerase sigma-70 factor (ECF subfamily)